jgi:hypothetical protein
VADDVDNEVPAADAAVAADLQAADAQAPEGSGAARHPGGSLVDDLGALELDGAVASAARLALDIELHELDGLESAPRAHDELAAGHGSGKRVVRVA